MTQILSLEFLVAALCIINVFLFLLLGIIVKRVNRMHLAQGRFPGAASEPADRDNPTDQAISDSAREIMDMLVPLVTEAKQAASSFDEQIREKRRLSKNLNDAIDSRIISINLLLSRAETLHKRLEEQQKEFRQAAIVPPVQAPSVPPSQINVVDQQNQIIELYFQQVDVDTIAQRLSIPKGEVQLVIDLKEKFMAMEQAG